MPMPDETCPGCNQPITPADWLTCVAVTRDGARAHLGCLRAYGLPIRAGCLYLWARPTMPAAALRPGAWFGLLRDDAVLIECPAAECERQVATLHTHGYGDGIPYYSADLARLARLGPDLTADAATALMNAELDKLRHLGSTFKPPMP